MRWRRYSLLSATFLLSEVLVVISGITTNLISDLIPVKRAYGTAIVAVAVLLIAFGAWRKRRDADGALAVDLDGVADELARAVDARLRNEEERRRITDPVPLPVRWHPAPAELADHPANVSRSAVGSQPAPLTLSAGLDQIAGVYRGIPSRRLVILGGAGSGKTVLACRLARDLLAGRRQPAEPVPIMVNLAAWDPEIPLRDWIAQQVERDHPRLVERYSGQQSLAAALAENDRLLPILDGLDEINAGLREAVLVRLNEASTLPLVVTSRPQQYAAATSSAGVLAGSAAVELEDLTLPDILDYMVRTDRRRSPDDSASGWAAVREHVTANPHGGPAAVLQETLKNPLQVHLARSIYSDDPQADPRELLDNYRFCTADDLRRHLITAYTPAIYRHPRPSGRTWRTGQVEGWLTDIAHDLDHRGTLELAWWQLADGVPPLLRGLIVWTPFMLFSIALFGLTIGVPAFGFALGIIIGLFFLSEVVGHSPAPSRNSWDLRTQIRIVRRYTIRGLLFGLAGGLVLLLTFGMFGRPLPEEVPLRWRILAFAAIYLIGVAMCVVYGAIAGVFAALAKGFETTIDLSRVADPASSLAAARSRALVRWLVFGLMAVPVFLPVLGPLAGCVYSVAVGGAVALRGSAWMRWLIYSRCWLPLRGRLPWSLPTFLDDAHQRGLLRTTGTVYQFRHIQLHHHYSTLAQHRHPSRRSWSWTQTDATIKQAQR